MKSQMNWVCRWPRLACMYSTSNAFSRNNKYGLDSNGFMEQPKRAKPGGRFRMPLETHV